MCNKGAVRSCSALLIYSRRGLFNQHHDFAKLKKSLNSRVEFQTETFFVALHQQQQSWVRAGAVWSGSTSRSRESIKHCIRFRRLLSDTTVLTAINSQANGFVTKAFALSSINGGSGEKNSIFTRGWVSIEYREIRKLLHAGCHREQAD